MPSQRGQTLSPKHDWATRKVLLTWISLLVHRHVNVPRVGSGPQEDQKSSQKDPLHGAKYALSVWATQPFPESVKLKFEVQ